MIRRQLLAGLVMLAVMTAITGVAYPLLVTALGRALFPDQAAGSLVVHDGRAVGSRLVAQAFVGPAYFHPRPSAVGHDGENSGGSNLGPTNPLLIEEAAARAGEYRRLNGLEPTSPVPLDAVTASASGLDPHISVANARIQAARVAGVRDMPDEDVQALIESNTEYLPLLSEPVVNVLRLNIALENE